MKEPIKLLLVDDEPDILEFLSYNFRKKGYLVSTAINGVEGINKAAKELPDLIISDILMPEMDGIEMCKEMRNNETLMHIPFIFLTALGDDNNLLFALSSGADQFSSKPLQFENLLFAYKPIRFEALNYMVNHLIEERANNFHNVTII